VLAITVVYLDAQTPLDSRLLAPLNVLVVLALPALSTLPSQRVLAAGVVGVAALNLTVDRGPDPAQYHYLRFGESPTVAAARRYAGPIVSNGPGALWLINGTEAQWIPERVDPHRASIDPNYDENIGRLRDELALGGQLVWLDAFNYRSYLPSEEAVVRELGLRLVQDLPDGAVYAATITR
jgi:hypothetical protein